MKKGAEKENKRWKKKNVCWIVDWLDKKTKKKLDGLIKIQTNIVNSIH
jgi:hypothetical protein